MDADLSLLEATDCRTLFRPREKRPDDLFRSLLEKDGNLEFELPELNDLLDPNVVDAYPWTKTYAEVANEPFLVLHTSGSTGFPKPVDIRHNLIATIDAQQLLQDIAGRHVTAREWANRRVYTALPPFHSAGWNFFSYSCFQSTELILGPSQAPPSVHTVELVLKHGIAEAGILPPSLLAEVATDDELVKTMCKWSSVTYGGGPLPQAAGDALQTKLKVLQILGSTETFNLPELLPAEQDEWPYHCYHPSLGIQFREHMQGLYELVFVRTPGSSRHQGAFCTFPDADEYSMKDLYERHPRKSDLWRYRGRLDDIIVLSNGEKFNPVSAESWISHETGIKSALVVGAGQEQPGILVEPSQDHLGSRDKHYIVSKVLGANEMLPSHAQIHPSHVRLLHPDQNFLRSSKGEVQRMPTIKALKDDIDDLYSNPGIDTESTQALETNSLPALTGSILQIMSKELLSGAKIRENDNIFDFGFDSLKVTRLLRLVRRGLSDRADTVQKSLTARTIYQNPSAAMLSNALMQSITGESPSPAESDAGETSMQQILDSYTSKLNDLERTDVIVLTGSTGSVGSYFLDCLIQQRKFAKIVCLNRTGGTIGRQQRIHQSRGLTDEFSNVQFLECDLTKDKLGLSEAQYAALTNETTHIFHGAWEVNFNLPMSSFEPQLDACYRLIELAHRSMKHPEVTFISSVGAANNWAYIYDGRVPEQALGDFAVAEPMGYAQSKLLGELLFLDANRRFSVPVTICRVGQVAGPVKTELGAWNLNEWFPSVMNSAKALGKLPDSLGAMDRMDWVPVDILADVLEEIVTKKTQTGEASRAQSKEHECSDAEFFGVVNPRVSHWSQMVAEVASCMVPRPEVVPYTDWLAALKNASDQRPDEVESIPAIKLLDFFHDIGRKDAKRPQFATAMTEKACPTLREAGPVSIEWLALWMRQWGMRVDLDLARL